MRKGFWGSIADNDYQVEIIMPPEQLKSPLFI